MSFRPDRFDGILTVPPEHDAIDRELLNWAGWLRGRRGGGSISPMFRMFQSNMTRGGYGVPTAAPLAEAPRALAVERAVRLLPDRHCELLRGWYVAQLPPFVLARGLAVRPEELVRTLHDARTMLQNTMDRPQKANDLAQGERNARRFSSALVFAND